MNITIVSRHSKYEWRRKSLGLTHDQLLNKYNGREQEIENLLKSHETQLKVRAAFERTFKNTPFLMMDQLNDLKDVDMVIVLGGDDSFKYVSHSVGAIPLLGVNSDPNMSKGWLTSYSVRNDDDVYNLKNKIYGDYYKILEWPRPEILLNGHDVLPSATNEYFLGIRNDRVKTSKHIIKYKGVEYKQKCSGLLIANGAGFTGWFYSALDSAASVELFDANPFAEKFYFQATELNTPERPHISEHGEILPGDEFIVHSLNDEGGKIVIDSWMEFDFNYGSEALVRLGNPLIIVQISK